MRAISTAGVRQKPLVWITRSGVTQSQPEFAVFAATNSQILVYSKVGRLLAHITRSVKSPLSDKYLFKTSDDSFRMEARKTGLSIEGNPGNVGLVHLQNGTTNLILVLAPLPLEQALPGVLTCALESPLLDLMAPYLDTRLAVDVPSSGITNISGRVLAQQDRTIMDFKALDFVRAWQSKWESGHKTRALLLERLQQELSGTSEDAVEQTASAEKTEGLNLPLVKQALWGVMAQYERTTLQEVDRIVQEAERREQFGKNSSYNSGRTASTRKKTVSETSSKTNELEQITQARTSIRSMFARKEAVAAYQAAIIVFQKNRLGETIKASARQAVLRGLAQEALAAGTAKLTPLRCDVFAAGMDGQRVWVMQWSANKQ